MGSGDLSKLKFYWSDHKVRLTLETLDDPRNDVRCAGASHGKVDQRLVPRNLAELLGHRKLVLRDERTDEKMIARQFDS
jgi:hypothetical protein